jgi:DHA1 family bicyclomycin/chloramphenicol resistance-like MFS transporter
MNSRIALPPRRLAPLLGALAMFGAFSIDTMFPAFPDIAAEFGVGKVAMQQTISVYLFAYAVMSLLHGPLSDAIGRRRVIIGGLAVFTVASVGCALAPGMGWLLFFRLIQGLSAGVGMIVGRAVVRDVFDGHDAQRLMSQVSMIFGLAPAIAPVIGGWLLGWADWRAIFWFLAAFGALVLLAVLLALPETHPHSARKSMRASDLWHGNVAMLRNHTFVHLSLIASCNFGALFLYISSASAFVLDILHLNAQQFGWFFAPMISGMMLGAFTSGRLAGRVSGTTLANTGFIVCTSATLVNLLYNLLTSNPVLPWAVLPLMLNAFGVALAFPIITLLILDMYPRQRGAASSLQAFISLGLNAIIAGVLAAAIGANAALLAATTAAFSVCAGLLWWRYLRRTTSLPGKVAAPMTVESGEGM